MNPERWRRIGDIFAAVADRPVAERAALLDAACGGDADLRREVESLLASDARTGGPIDQVISESFRAVAAGAPPTGDAPLAAAGRRVGAWEIVRELGHGGMGVVYLAVRADDQYRQQVAIKVVRGGLHAPHLVQRFLGERQILANLNHPNIARLLDGGTTEEGFPYVVMEYVEGEPIDRYCSRLGLPERRRLGLFRQVCGAVQYAHRNLVVHRDIKPANILVTAEGQAKLLDFGIAKLVDPAAPLPAGAATGTAMRLLTPEYASPEQVRGEAITTASDVYSLGVLLYELLTGRLPYRTAGRTPAELERVICESSPDDIGRDLPGDLGTIVLMALRKEPERRYASVEQLSEDIGRSMEGLPVRARQDTFAYRTRKFVRRNPLGVAAVAVITILLMGFAVSMALQSARVTRERDRARREAQTAREVSEFLVDLFKVPDPDEARGRAVTAREVLDRGARSIGTELKDQPAVQARLMDTMAEVYKNLGLYDEAVGLAEQGLALRRTHLGEEGAEVQTSMLTLASIEHLRGRYDDAERLILGALAQQRAEGGEARDRIASLNQLGILRSAQGRLPEARAAHEEALDLARRTDGERSEAAGVCMNNLAQVLLELGEYDDAERLHRATLALRTASLGEVHPDIASSLGNLGTVLDRMGRLDEAEEIQRRNLDMCRTLYAADHPVVGLALNNLSSVLKVKGAAVEAESLQREAHAIFRQVHGEEHPLVALCLNNLANLRHDQGDYEGAEALHRQSLALNRRLYGEEHPRIADTLNNLGNLLWDKGAYARAAPHFRAALAMDRKLLGESHPYVAMDMNALAMALHGSGHLEEAEDLYRRAIAMSTALQGEANPSTATYQASLGLLLAGSKRAPEGEPLLRQAMATLETAFPEDHWQIHQTRSMLGACLAALGRFEEAEPLLVNAHRALLRVKGSRHGVTRRARASLIDLYTAMQLPERAAAVRAEL